jgi:hypothetical protein
MKEKTPLASITLIKKNLFSFYITFYLEWVSFLSNGGDHQKIEVVKKLLVISLQEFFHLQTTQSSGNTGEKEVAQISSAV